MPKEVMLDKQRWTFIPGEGGGVLYLEGYPIAHLTPAPSGHVHTGALIARLLNEYETKNPPRPSWGISWVRDGAALGNETCHDEELTWRRARSLARDGATVTVTRHG